jgi:hypothetical protein
MVNWKITATTVFCDAIDGEATFIVYKNKSAKCVTHQKYGSPDREIIRQLREKSKQLGRSLRCDGPECFRLTEYRDKLFNEESD